MHFSPAPARRSSIGSASRMRRCRSNCPMQAHARLSRRIRYKNGLRSGMRVRLEPGADLRGNPGGIIEREIVAGIGMQAELALPARGDCLRTSGVDETVAMTRE